MERVLIVADLEDWILGKIARKLAKLLAENSCLDVRIIFSNSPNFLSHFVQLQFKYDVVHFLSCYDFLNYAIVTYRPCVVMIWHMIDSDWHLIDKNLFRVDALSVGSEQWFRICKQRLSNGIPLKRLHYGLDLNVFQKQQNARTKFLEEYNFSDNTLVFGFAGKASSNEGNRKGVDRMIDCINHLISENNLPIVIRIIGRQWNFNFLPDKLKPLVKFTPDIPDEKLPEFYSSLDYYLCTSRLEGVPYPVLESMSCECVVISTLVGVVPEIIVHGHNGFILNEDHIEESLVDIIRNTANNLKYRQFCGSEARKTIVKLFSWEKAVDPKEYIGLYQDAVQYYQSREMIQRIILFLNALKRVILFYLKR